MAYGKPSWIAVHLLGDAAARLVRDVRSESVRYASTGGPFPGVAGAALSWFQITALALHSGDTVVFADERLLGWFAPGDFTPGQPLNLASSTPGLRSPATCPLLIPTSAPDPGQQAEASRT